MTYFLKSGITFRVSSKEAMDLHEQLPAGNYTIKKDPFDNLYLESIDSFEIKGKRYGDLVKNTDRILNTFMDRTASTGVMLTGEKGSGKSLLAKALSIQAATDGIPTIVINQPWTGDKFNALIQSIEQPCVVLFDEFEKVYDSQEQEAMLTLLDGVFPSKKLFVITCNDKWRVDSHMRNRPGRIYYMLDYKGLTHDFIIEYCEDNLKNKTYIERICSIASLFSQFNFDMLKALIEEMNRYDESPEEALKMLNAKPEFDDGNKYITNLNFKGIPVDQKHLETREWKGNPLQNKINLSFKISDAGVPWTDKDENDEEADWNWEETNFTPAEIQKIDPATGTFIFMNNEGVALTLTKVKEKTFQYYDAF
jgi:hypothetical protein